MPLWATARGGAMTHISDFIKHAEAMARIASEVAMRHFRGGLEIEFKSDESPVTQADRAVEAAVREYLAKHFPDHGIFGEEEGAKGVDQRHLWVIDPIDGTRSFLSSHPLFGFLLALLEDGLPRIGLVAMPALGEVFVGGPGGAALNGKAIATSGIQELKKAVLYVNEAEKILQDQPDAFVRLTHSGQTRRFGYDCYPHALLSAGFVDAVVDFDLKPYDFLPVAALVEAAGGVITDWSGRPLTLYSDGRVVAAATPELHHELLELLT